MSRVGADRVEATRPANTDRARSGGPAPRVRPEFTAPGGPYAALRELPPPLQRSGLSRLRLAAGNRAMQWLVAGLSDRDGSAEAALKRAERQVQRTLAGPAEPAAGTPVAEPAAGTPVVQRALDADLKAMTDVYGPVHYEGMLTAIRAAPVAERRAVLTNDALRAQITARLGRYATQVMAALLEGSQQWRNPPSNDFFDYFIVRSGTGTLPEAATLNCWEAILYAAYLAGQINAAWIRAFYANALSAADPNAMLWGLLGASRSLPTYPARTPREGQLLFYYRPGLAVPAHVALSMGGDEAISLWNQPNNNRAVQRIQVTDLSGTVHIGDPPW